MPPDGYSSFTISDDVFEQLGFVMAEYDCESPAEAIETGVTFALKRDEAELAQILADWLAMWPTPETNYGNLNQYYGIPGHRIPSFGDYTSEVLWNSTNWLLDSKGWMQDFTRQSQVLGILGLHEDVLQRPLLPAVVVSSNGDMIGEKSFNIVQLTNNRTSEVPATERGTTVNVARTPSGTVPVWL